MHIYNLQYIYIFYLYIDCENIMGILDKRLTFSIKHNQKKNSLALRKNNFTLFYINI